MGSAIARGNYTFVFQTTKAGDSYTNGTTLLVSAQDTKRYFNFIFPVFSSLTAAVELKWL